MRHCRRRLLQSAGHPVPGFLCRQIFLWRPLQRLDPVDGPRYEHSERLRHRHLHAGRSKGWSRRQPLLSHPRRQPGWTSLESQRDRNWDPHANSYRGANPYSYAESYVNANSYSHGHSYGYSYSYSYANVHRYRYRNGHRCTHTNGYRYSYAYCYGHSLPYAFFTNACPVNPNTDAYCYAAKPNTNTYSPGFADADSYRPAFSDAHFDPGASAAAKHIDPAAGRDR